MTISSQQTAHVGSVYDQTLASILLNNCIYVSSVLTIVYSVTNLCMIINMIYSQRENRGTILSHFTYITPWDILSDEIL